MATENSDKRFHLEEVRDEDLEPYVTLRYIARLFKILAILMVVMLIGEVIIYAAGIPWLDAACGLPSQKGFEFGLYPFVIGDTIKLFIAAGLLPGAWQLLRRFRPTD